MDQDLYYLTEKYNVLTNVEEEDKKRFKNILSWSPQAMELSVKERLVKGTCLPKRSEIWTCSLGENVGSEMNKTRPCGILQANLFNDKSPTVIVFPITTTDKPIPTHVGLSNDDLVYVEQSIHGMAVIEQIRVISKARLGRRVGKLTEDAMDRIEKALFMTLDLQTWKTIALSAMTATLDTLSLSDEDKVAFIDTFKHLLIAE